MRRLLPVLFIVIGLFSACEDVIHPSLPKADPVLVIDAWLTNKPGEQIIKVNQSLPYFVSSPLPGVSGAAITVMGDDGTVYPFGESDSAGIYVWKPDSSRKTFGDIGVNYQLSVVIGEDKYIASCRLNPVPPIDSISFKYDQGNQFMSDSWTAQFYATDIPGYGNTYWIKAYKNGKFLNKPSEINIAFDAGFSEGSVVDGIQFIQPIRQGINPFEQDDNGKILPSYLPGDSVYVEINSISLDAFNFLSEVSTQTNRPGGFSELFSQPLANVPTNIVASNPDKPAIGFFNVAAVSALGRKLEVNATD